MAYPLYISAAGAQVQSQRLESITNNLANANTPGFKRDVTLFQARFAQAIADHQDYPGSGSINNVGGGVMLAGTKTEFAPGAYQNTRIDTDLAIEGEGFFMVRRGDQNMLTRAGNFRLANDGTLVTNDGYPVLNEILETIVIDPDLGPWQVTSEGMVRQDGTDQPLALVMPRSYGDLAKAGDNLFAALAPVDPLAPEQRRVLSGYLEMSGVKPAFEMMDMIEASRAFEANVNMVRHHDMMLSALVNRVMKSS